MSEQKSEVRNHFNDLIQKWPSSFVSRDKVPEFTGGAISSGRMANLDCLREGPSQRIRLGRKVCYPIKPFIEWLIKRSVAL